MIPEVGIQDLPRAQQEMERAVPEKSDYLPQKGKLLSGVLARKWPSQSVHKGAWQW